MKDAGLTHGGFYAHFPSREAMLAEAADRAGSEGVAMMERIAATSPPSQALQAMMRAYLSKAHVEGVEAGCAIAALGSEMPRQAPEVRHAATRRIKEMIDLVARQSPDWGQPGAHERALVTVATMVGDTGAGACRRRPQAFRRTAQSSAAASRSDSELTPLGTRVCTCSIFNMTRIIYLPWTYLLSDPTAATAVAFVTNPTERHSHEDQRIHRPRNRRFIRYR